MAQHLSVPSPPCATHRYCHSSAFISGHDSRLHSVTSWVISGVTSIGIRLQGNASAWAFTGVTRPGLLPPSLSGATRFRA